MELIDALECRNEVVCAQPLRVAAVISSLEAGGAERVMSTLANAWAREGHEVCVVTLSGGEIPDFYPLAPEIGRERLGAQRESHNAASAILNNIERWQKLRKVLRMRTPDVVVAFLTNTNVLAVAAAFRLGIPVIVAERISPEDHAVSRHWHLGRRIAYGRAARVVMLTKRSARWLDANIPRAKATVIPNPVLVKRGQQPDSVVRIILERCTGSEILLAIGRLDRQKGFDLLLEAFASLGDVSRNWRLVIAGEGGERESLEALVARLGLSGRVLLPGVTATPHALMERAGLFVLSSRYEGMPNVLMEAMACGLACISFDCRTGPSEVVTDGVDGVLVPAGDVAALARAMETVMGDLDLRRRLGESARCCERRYALPAILEKWNGLFRDVVRDSRRTGTGDRHV